MYVGILYIFYTRNMTNKQLGLIGYFFELGYELMLLPNQDVSENPGFESEEYFSIILGSELWWVLHSRFFDLLNFVFWIHILGFENGSEPSF